MALGGELGGKLDAGSAIQGLLTGIVGPAAGISAIQPPVDAQSLAGAGQRSGQVDTSSLGPVVASAAAVIEPLLARLPVAADVMQPIQAAVSLTRTLATGNLGQQVQALLAQVQGEFSGAHSDPFLTVLHRVAEIVSGAPDGQVLLDLVKSLIGFVGGGQVTTGGFGAIGDTIGAFDGLVRATGGMMALESILSDAERTTELLASHLDADAVQRAIARLDSSFGSGATSLATFVSSLADHPEQVEPVVAAVEGAVRDLVRVGEGLTAGMAFGEATLISLNLAAVQQELASASDMVRSAELTPTGRLVAAMVERARPFVQRFDPSLIPQLTIDRLLDDLSAQVATYAQQIATFDTTVLTQPIADLIGKITGAFTAIADLLDRITVAVRAALQQVADTIGALPIQAIVDAIKTVLDPISQAFKFLSDLIETVQHTLETVAGDAQKALGDVEKVVDDFKAGVDELFGVAKRFVEGLHLDRVIGQIADRIREFSQLLAKVQMKPYFDTAVDVIGTTGDVVGKIPFGLLPDSMKSQVDDAVRPVKEVDADAFKLEIESIVQITPDGKFALRADLTDAIAGVQHAYEQLLAQVRQHDPSLFLAQIDQQLDGVKASIEAIAPQLHLQPLRDAIDKVRQAIVGLDVEKELKPVQDVFDRVVAAVDQYSPVNLVRPIQTELDQARAALVGRIKLDQWVPTLDGLRAKGVALIAQLDPPQIKARLASALDDARKILQALPDDGLIGPLGTLVAMLLGATRLRLHPPSFAPAVAWMRRRESGGQALAGRGTCIADYVSQTRAAVSSVDAVGMVGRVGGMVAGVRAAIDALPASDGKTRLGQLAVRLDTTALVALAVNRTRYLAELDDAVQRCETLKRTGFSEVDDCATRVREAFAPAALFSDLLSAVLARFGIRDLDRGARGVLLDVFAAVTPDRLAGVVEPLIGALQNRVSALLDAVVTPLRAGAGEVKRAIDAVDLAPLVDAIDHVVTEVKTQILALSPMTLLAAPLASFNSLKAEIAAFDPLAPITHLLDALKAAVERLIDKLKASVLLAVPLEIYDDIMKALESINPNGLLDPVFNEVDELAHEVSDGLDRTVAAFKQLQAALPGGGGGGALSASVSVG